MTNGMDLPDSDWGDFSCRRAVDSSSCGLLMSYVDIDLDHIGSGYGLLPEGTKPLPEPILTHHQYVSIT